MKYRLATKTPTGEIKLFGPVMAMRQAQEKQSALAKLSTYPVYVVNTQAETQSPIGKQSASLGRTAGDST